jgi:hypothetical protein
MATIAGPSTATATDEPSRGADLTGRVLLWICAASTMVAFAGGIIRIGVAPPEWVLTEFWRTTAYLVFAGMWAMLALWPRAQRGMWELILLQKTLVTVQALLFLDLPYAVMTAWIDGAVVIATVAAWFLCRGWLTWRRPRARAVAA